MRDAECPYCGADEEINHDDGYGYEESDMHQQECGSCGKNFTYFTAIHFTYTTYKADCLNGGEHDYRKTETYPPEFARMRCKQCGDEKPLTANAKVSGFARFLRGVRWNDGFGVSPAPTFEREDDES